MSGSLIVSNLEEKIQFYRGQQFTGLVKITSQNEHQWVIYYLLGRIVWIKSRIHSLRRWRRHLAIHSPVFFEQITPATSLSYESWRYESWNYASLARLVKLKQFRRDQFSKVVESCITENLFDILQVGTVQQAQLGKGLTYEAHSKEAADLPFIMLQQEVAWPDAQQEWLVWEQAGLAKFSPDWAPTIAQIETLKAQTPPQTFKTLTTFVDGENTLRDLANKFKQPIIPLTKSILPYVSRKMLGLIEIPDLIENANDGFDAELLDSGITAIAKVDPVSVGQNDPHAVNTPTATKQPHLPNIVISANTQALVPAAMGQPINTTPTRKQGRSQAPRIIYIDDSPADSRSMCAIVEDLGYQYTNIPDPLQALPLLIEYKPKLIFLDLVMPIANGYEVCAQIRRISSLKETPVIIVTSNDGIADRVRARLVGASGFLGKPIQHKKVAKVLKKHLRHLAVTSELNSPKQEKQGALSRS
jgi:two-component system, chemotaxis family, response regulator PixG